VVPLSSSIYCEKRKEAISFEKKVALVNPTPYLARDKGKGGPPLSTPYLARDDR